MSHGILARRGIPPRPAERYSLHREGNGVSVPPAGVLTLIRDISVNGDRTTVKPQRIKCRSCGERFDFYRYGPGRPPIYCETCRHERKLERAREGMARLRRQQSRS